jgi:hypothetical protein
MYACRYVYIRVYVYTYLHTYIHAHVCLIKRGTHAAGGATPTNAGGGGGMIFPPGVQLQILKRGDFGLEGNCGGLRGGQEEGMSRSGGDWQSAGSKEKASEVLCVGRSKEVLSLLALLVQN